MFCSTVIPTIGRSTLSRAVNSVLDQKLKDGDYEVIVVNDSGVPLPKADWQRSERVQILETNRRERSVARNSGAALAKGKFLHFLDDDDWLLPGAFENFFDLTQSGNAIWLYGASRLVNQQGELIIHLRNRMQGNCFLQSMAGEWIPLQASLIDANQFFSVGGFTPTMSATEDIDLLRRILLVGDVAYTEDEVVCIRVGPEGSSTDYSVSIENGRRAREEVLSAMGAFDRMRSSASSSYWYGRMVRVYWTSAAWNLWHGRLFAALNRFFFGFKAAASTGSQTLSSSFWRSMATSYESPTFLKGFQEVNRPVERRSN